MPMHTVLPETDREHTAVNASLLADFRWPAEWEEHVCTWAAWPINPATWPGIFHRIPTPFANLIATIAKFEPASVLAGTAELQNKIRPVLDEACDRIGSQFPVRLVDIAVNDSWCRDHGPLFLTGRDDSPRGGQSLIVDWGYNAWGKKYGPWDLDILVAGKIGGLLQIPVVKPPLILEGGAIEGDGRGTILTTESCLTNPNRNPGATRDSMKHALQIWMRADHVVWIPGGGIIGDDTDGHIDQSARFVSKATVVAASPWNEDAPEAADLRRNRVALESAVDSAGDSLQVIDLPLPAPKFHRDHRLPASYCNYILTNGAVIVPTFRDPADDVALQVLQDCFADRVVVGLDAMDLVWGLGAFHCLTQQQPQPLCGEQSSRRNDS